MTDLISPRWYEVGPTQRLDGDGFFVSYIPDTSQITPYPLVNQLFAGEQSEETALCRTDAAKYIAYILTGDFRQQYEDRIDEGWDACYQFYKVRKVTHQSMWSTDYENKEQR